LAMYTGGFLHLFHAPFALALPSVMLLAGARGLRDVGRTLRAEAAARCSPSGPASRLLRGSVLAFGVLGVAWAYLGAMTPEAINFDASWSHLPIAVDYARHGGILPFDGDYTRNVPSLASLIYTWAMILP